MPNADTSETPTKGLDGKPLSLGIVIVVMLLVAFVTKVIAQLWITLCTSAPATGTEGTERRSERIDQQANPLARSPSVSANPMLAADSV